MANITVTNLPQSTSLTGLEAVPIVQSGTSVQTTTQAIANLNANNGTVTSITAVSPLSGGTITTTGSVGLNTNSITNSYLYSMSALSIKGNNSGSSAQPQDLTVAQTMTLLGAAPLASPAFTGSPTAPTPSTGDSSTLLATTAFVKAQSYGTGTVTSVTAGTGLSGGTITGSGTIAIASTGVTAQTYGTAAVVPQITVNAQGQITSATNLSIGLDASQIVTGILPVAVGGTGVNSSTGSGSVVLSASPTLTGVPLAPTASSGTNTQQIATTAFVSSNYVPSTATITAGAGLFGGGLISSSPTISIANINDASVLSNISGSSASPIGNTLSSVFDYVFGSTQGDILYRSATGWTALPPGTPGQLLQTQGSTSNPVWFSAAVGGVTQVNTGTNLTGGPISSVGTISTVNNPVFSTSVQSPLLIGGTGPGAQLTLESTSGVGATDSIIFKTGSQVTAMTIGTTQNVLIGTGAVSTTRSLTISKNITGGTTAYAILNNGTIQSDVTTAAYGILIQPATAAASFTLGSLQYFTAAQSTLGIGSQITAQIGFTVQNLTNAVTNTGISIQMASGQQATISNVALTSNVVTITTAANHNYGPGQSVIVAAVTNTSVNGTFTITSIPSTTTFTYALVAADIASTADTGFTYVNALRYGINASSTAQSQFGGAMILGVAPNTTGLALSSGQPTTFKSGAGAVYTDIVSSGTVTVGANAIFKSNIISSRLSTTYTVGANVYISDAPTSSGNATITNSYALYVAAGTSYFGAAITSTNGPTFYSATAVPAGGTAGTGIKMSSTSNLGIFFGSGAPTLSAAQGSIYIRTDGSSIATRLYINTNGSTTWTNVVTAA